MFVLQLTEGRHYHKPGLDFFVEKFNKYCERIYYNIGKTIIRRKTKKTNNGCVLRITVHTGVATVLEFIAKEKENT
jgi:hypothetical protein